VSKCRNLVVDGYRGRGRGRKKWMECVEKDMRDMKLNKDVAQDRVAWRAGILGNHLTCAGRHRKTDVKTMMMMMIARVPCNLDEIIISLKAKYL
jgi:hypothetical protein